MERGSSFCRRRRRGHEAEGAALPDDEHSSTYQQCEHTLPGDVAEEVHSFKDNREGDLFN